MKNTEKHLQYLTPGPSELYFTLADHLRTAISEKVASVSHRSDTFRHYFRKADEALRVLLQIPPDYRIVFTSSANEIWERLLQNCVRKHSFHFVNGAFSEKFYNFSQQLGKSAQKEICDFGSGFTDLPPIPPETEMIALTHTETSSGVCFSPDLLAALRRKYPQMLLTVDAVSAIPYPAFDYTHFDALYFSVQKAMGLPAGLGVWLVNQRCADKARQLQNEGQAIGTYHSLPTLLQKAADYQTPETPNVLAIYLLAKVAEDMHRKGITQIRQEIDYKAAFLYRVLSESKHFAPLVKDEKMRSKTVIVAKCLQKPAAEVIAYFRKNGILVGAGYGKYKDTQIRIANFPTHSKEIIFRLIDLIEKM